MAGPGPTCSGPLPSRQREGFWAHYSTRYAACEGRNDAAILSAAIGARAAAQPRILHREYQGSISVLFNSFAFVVFFSVVIVLYYAATGRLQNLVLLGASYFFYGYWDYRFLSLLVGVTLLVYFCARGIEATESPEKRKWLMLFAVAVLLVVLGIFKYFNFFADSLV